MASSSSDAGLIEFEMLYADLVASTPTAWDPYVLIDESEEDRLHLKGFDLG